LLVPLAKRHEQGGGNPSSDIPMANADVSCDS
jgi:hypothetical protein